MEVYPHTSGARVFIEEELNEASHVLLKLCVFKRFDFAYLRKFKGTPWGGPFGPI